MPTFTLLTTTMPGLAEVCRSEVETILGRQVRFMGHAKTRAYDLNLFKFEGNAGRLLMLRTVEDLFWVMAEMELSGHLSDLKKLESLRLNIVEAAKFKKELQGGKSKSRPSFRLVVQAEDVRWRKYRRINIKKELTAATIKKLPGWRLVEDDADIEVWVQQSNRRLIVSVRLSDARLRHRDYIKLNRPAALRPTISAALCWLSEPRDSDIFLDPMCGTGTILIERALMGRYQQLLGGDIESEAVESTEVNFGNKHKPWSIQQWDVRNLPLADQSVDVVVTNPPWGRQIGDTSIAASLYQDMIWEFQRVLMLEGRAVIITSQWGLLNKALSLVPTLKLRRTIKNVSVLGWHADIFVINKTI